jgi:hypothetical protein
MGVLYATVERVKLDGDIRGADLNPQIARALESASRSIDGVSPGGGRLGYRFYPEIATRYFSQLSTRDVTSLTLGRYTLAGTPTSVTNGGTALTAGVDYVLLPQEGPPYNELRIITSAVWSSAFRGVAIVGPWGFNIDETPAGTIAEDLDISETGVDVSDISAIGIGTIIRVDSERMIVTGKDLLTSGQTLGTPLTAFNDDQLVAVANGAAFHANEVITLDAERMLIESVAGNTLTVTRAYDGSAIAAHTGATIYAPRTLTVQRGALGTTAATHTNGAVVNRLVIPALVESLAIAEALEQLQQESGAYAGTAGEGGSVPIGAGLPGIRADAELAYRRPVTWLGV